MVPEATFLGAQYYKASTVFSSPNKYRTTIIATLTKSPKKVKSDNNQCLYSPEDHMEDWQLNTLSSLNIEIIIIIIVIIIKFFLFRNVDYLETLYGSLGSHVLQYLFKWDKDNSPQRQLAPRQLAPKKTRPRQLAPHSEDNSPHIQKTTRPIQKTTRPNLS